ncbi:hypothetical protein ES703_90142 [subsurface metagenome]
MIGYDKYSINHQLLLGLTFEEMTGILTHDRAKRYHPFTLTGTLVAPWGQMPSGLPHIRLDGAADYLQCPAALSADLNFTSEDFTLLAWVFNNGPSGSDMIMCQGHYEVDGFEFYVADNLNIALRTNQTPAAHTGINAVGAFTPSEWQLIGVTRHGTSGQFYVQGVPVDTLLNGGLTDPTDVAGGNKLLIGVQDGEISNFWEGDITLPRIWNRQLSAEEMLQIFSIERHWFNV